MPSNSTDIVHFVYWKRQGWLAAYVPEDVARWPASARDADGFYAAPRATFSVIGYNTEQLTPENAPTSYADLLDAKWKGKIVKAHPAYSGNCMTTTFVLSRLLGWEYFKTARAANASCRSSPRMIHRKSWHWVNGQ